MPIGIYLRSEKEKQRLRILLKPFQFKRGHKGYKGMLGNYHTEKTKEYLREIKTGSVGYWEGKKRPPFPDEWCKNIGKGTKKRWANGSLQALKPGYWLGKKRPDISEKLRKANLGKIGYWKNRRRPEMMGENNPSWIDGRSFEPYTLEWTNELRERIKIRDNFTCQLCSTNLYLDVHHIDYDKKNCNPDNLITLCHSCNGKVNFNREYWQKYFTQQLIKLYSN